MISPIHRFTTGWIVFIVQEIAAATAATFASVAATGLKFGVCYYESSNEKYYAENSPEAKAILDKFRNTEELLKKQTKEVQKIYAAIYGKKSDEKTAAVEVNGNNGTKEDPIAIMVMKGVKDIDTKAGYVPQAIDMADTIGFQHEVIDTAKEGLGLLKPLTEFVGGVAFEGGMVAMGTVLNVYQLYGIIEDFDRNPTQEKLNKMITQLEIQVKNYASIHDYIRGVISQRVVGMFKANLVRKQNKIIPLGLQ